MHEFDRVAAAEAVARLRLRPDQDALAQYWLTLWTDNRLPKRGDFRPRKLKAQLPAIAIYDVVPDSSVTVRLAGTLYSAVLGIEITGMDWVATAPPEHRATRLRFFSEIARGAIGKGTRIVELDSGTSYEADEIFLPFCQDEGSGIYSVLGHVDWNPERRFSRVKSAEQAMGASATFEIIALREAR